MLTYQNNFAPGEDGRCSTSFAAWRSRMSSFSPELEFRKEYTVSREAFEAWRSNVKERLLDLLQMPPADPEQREPRLMKQEMRDGYVLEHWVFSPDRWSTVPFLMLKPEKVPHPLPAVLCFPGSHHPKEALAGEPMPDSPNCLQVRFPERNCQVLHYVKQGYIALAFDNPGTAMLAEVDSEGKETQWGGRVKLVEGLLDWGTNYPGYSLSQKIPVFEWLMKQPEIDVQKVAVSGHSLGSEIALFFGVLDDRISAIVFNDYLCDTRRLWCSVTEIKSSEFNGEGNWHTVPGIWKYFSFPDLLAAVMPKYLALNEGGAESFLDKVRTAYQAFGASSRLQITYYPRFAERPKIQEELPQHGLSYPEFYENYCSVDVPDHSFRPAPSLALLEKAFASGGAS